MLYGSLSIAVIGPFVIPAQLSLIQIDLKKIISCRIRPDIAIDKKFKLNLSALLRYVCTSARNLLATHIWYSCIDCTDEHQHHLGSNFEYERR